MIAVAPRVVRIRYILVIECQLIKPRVFDVYLIFNPVCPVIGPDEDVVFPAVVGDCQFAPFRRRIDSACGNFNLIFRVKMPVARPFREPERIERLMADLLRIRPCFRRSGMCGMFIPI